MTIETVLNLLFWGAVILALVAVIAVNYVVQDAKYKKRRGK